MFNTFGILNFQSSHSSRDSSPITFHSNKNELRHLSDVVEKVTAEPETFVDKLKQTDSKEMVRYLSYFVKTVDDLVSCFGQKCALLCAKIHIPRL